MQSTIYFCGATGSVWAAFPYSNRFLLVAICEGNAHWLSQCCHWVTDKIILHNYLITKLPVYRFSKTVQSIKLYNTGFRMINYCLHHNFNELILNYLSYNV